MLGIKQQTLADRADLSRQAISEFENGAAFPSTAAAKRMDSAIIGIIEERALEALKDRSDKPCEQESDAK